MLVFIELERAGTVYLQHIHHQSMVPRTQSTICSRQVCCYYSCCTAHQVSQCCLTAYVYRASPNKKANVRPRMRSCRRCRIIPFGKHERMRSADRNCREADNYSRRCAQPHSSSRKETRFSLVKPLLTCGFSAGTRARGTCLSAPN